MDEKAKILIVDDVDTNRFVLRDIVTEMGYQPLLAENGEQALKIVDRLWPQLIISDIAMPVMDGFEFCRTLKKDPRTRDIPVIFISAYNNETDMLQGFEVGGEDYIIKPFLPEVVKVRVGLHLKLYEANRQLSVTNRQLQTSLQKQLQQIESEKKNVLYALTRVAQENAAYDPNHMERICYNCRVLAEAMQLTDCFTVAITDDYIDTIELAAPLCDLGNLAVPAEILRKKEPLTEYDLNEIKKHVTVGGRIIKDVETVGDYNEFLAMSFDIAYYHHEHYDGSGYPEGKKGDAIPLSAQIVAVVGAYCALTEGRAYRTAYSEEEALDLMAENVGSKYDPRIFNILKKIVKQMK